LWGYNWRTRYYHNNSDQKEISQVREETSQASQVRKNLSGLSGQGRNLSGLSGQGRNLSGLSGQKETSQVRKVDPVPALRNVPLKLRDLFGAKVEPHSKLESSGRAGTGSTFLT
jgi:hypothetical protein